MDKQSDQTKVYDFIRANPGATTKAIRKGARVRHERATAILAEGVASGDLVMTAGFWGSQSYELAKTPDPKIPVPEQETPSKIPVPELQILVPESGNQSPLPEALLPAAQVLPPDLGYALLRPGPAFSGSRPISTDSQDAGKQANESAVPTPAREPWLVDLQRACQEAAEQGIRNAIAQMAEQAKEPKPEEKPVDPVAEGLLREIKSGARTQRVGYMVLQDYP